MRAVIGGLRRKTRSYACPVPLTLEGLDNIHGIRRVLEIATTGYFAMENNLSRTRTLGYLMLAALNVHGSRVN